jgi:type II secretion system protein J
MEYSTPKNQITSLEVRGTNPLISTLTTGFLRSQSGGFTLLEVVITIGIMLGLTLAVASMLRSGIDVKTALSEKSKVLHRMSVIMDRLTLDIQHAFYVSAKDTLKNGIDRSMKTVFKIDKQGSNDRLSLTTKTHKTIHAGRYESDLTYVVYELRDSQTTPGRKDLFRGETPYIPQDLTEEPPMRLMARDIKSLVFEFWNGERWSKDFWDTGRGDTRNRLPHLVRFTLEAFSWERVEGDNSEAKSDQAAEAIQTVVYLQDAWEYKELKDQDRSIKWEAF